MSNMIAYRNHNMLPETRFFDEFMRPFFGSMQQDSMRVDVKDEGDHYLLEAEIPGAKRDDVHVSVDDGVLTISAECNSEKKDAKDDKRYVINERRYGSVERSFSVDNIAEDQISAEFTDGVLKLTMPKKTPEEKTPRKIEIK